MLFRDKPCGLLEYIHHYLPEHNDEDCSSEHDWEIDLSNKLMLFRQEYHQSYFFEYALL